MIKLFHLSSAERTTSENSYFFYQHQKVYSFCLKRITGKKVLEIGSGSGYGTARIAKIAKHVIGIDNDRNSILQSRNRWKRKNVKFEVVDFGKISSHSVTPDLPAGRQGSIRGLDWIPGPDSAKGFVEARQARDDKAFDVIIALQFLEHIENVQTVLKKIKTLLKPGGVLILSTPNSLTQSYNENPYHFKEFSPDELKKLLAKNFRQVEMLGLFGDKKIQTLELERKQQVLRFFRLDPLRLRRLIPRRIRQYLFDFASSQRNVINKTSGVSETNFQIKRANLKNSIDLIAVCRK